MLPSLNADVNEKKTLFNYYHRIKDLIVGFQESQPRRFKILLTAKAKIVAFKLCTLFFVFYDSVIPLTGILEKEWIVDS